MEIAFLKVVEENLNTGYMNLNVIKAKEYSQQVKDLKKKIQTSQIKATIKVNIEMLHLYWEIGKSISDKLKTSNWGSSIVDKLSILIHQIDSELISRIGKATVKMDIKKHVAQHRLQQMWADCLKTEIVQLRKLIVY